MSLNVAREVARLQRLTVSELRNRYAEVFGETTNANTRTWLIKRIVWCLQAQAEGGLSERARQRALELASAALQRNAACSQAYRSRRAQLNCIIQRATDGHQSPSARRRMPSLKGRFRDTTRERSVANS
jgi:hypothetical protein